MSNGPEFFQTKMGHQFYDGTMPRLAKAAESIADSLQRLAENSRPPGVPHTPAQEPQPDPPVVGRDGSLRLAPEQWEMILDALGAEQTACYENPSRVAELEAVSALVLAAQTSEFNR